MTAERARLGTPDTLVTLSTGIKLADNEFKSAPKGMRLTGLHFPDINPPILDLHPKLSYTPIYLINRMVTRDRTSLNISEFLSYLASHPEAEHKLPTLTDLSQELGIGVAALREQLEVARSLGLVEVKPRTGMRRKPYSFAPAVMQSLDYAIALDKDHFLQFADLRQHVETAYWREAVKLLTPEDHETLQDLLTRAWEKLRGTPIEIPHPEHRELHLTIYRRLNNPFVTGLLQSYWDAYEAVGLNFFTDYNYLTQVWTYHQQMVDAICANDVDAGYKALTEHTDLIHHLISSSQ